MTDPTNAKPIKITITGGVKGQPISIRNRTNGDIIRATLTNDAKCQVDLQNLTNGYTAGDIIDFIVSGEVLGMNSLTTSGDAPQSVTVSTTAITSGLSRGI